MLGRNIGNKPIKAVSKTLYLGLYDIWNINMRKMSSWRDWINLPKEIKKITTNIENLKTEVEVSNHVIKEIKTVNNKEESKQDKTWDQKMFDYFKNQIVSLFTITGLWKFYDWQQKMEKEKYAKLPNISDINFEEIQHIRRTATTNLQEQISQIKDDIKVCVIVGEPGSGKTEISKRYIYEFKQQMFQDSFNDKRVIKFFHADKSEIFDDEYKKFADQLGIDIRNEQISELVDKVNNKLLERENWLLVFDNVSIENYQKIKSYIPKKQNGQKGQVLLTMQTMNKDKDQSAINIFNLKDYENRFSENEAMQLFNNIKPNNIDKPSEKLDLFNRLNYSPFAIKLAARFMDEKQEPIAKFIQRPEMLSSNIYVYQNCYSLQ